MHGQPRFLSESLRESLDPTNLRPRLLPLQSERNTHDHGRRRHFEGDRGDRGGSVPDRGEAKGSERRGKRPVRIAQGEPELAESEIHA